MALRFVLVALLGAGLLTLAARQDQAPAVSDVGPQAAADMGCSPEQIEMRPTRAGSDDDVVVTGCGKEARYRWSSRRWQAARMTDQ